jgi:hypothetical protein
MGELGWQSMEARYQQLRVSFWGKVQMMPSGSPIRGQVYEASSIFHASTDAGDYRVHAVEPEEGWDIVRPDSASARQTLWCAQLKCDLFQLGLRKHWYQPELFANLSPNQWRPLVKTAVRKRGQARWWREAQGRPILRTYVRAAETTRQTSSRVVSDRAASWWLE